MLNYYILCNCTYFYHFRQSTQCLCPGVCWLWVWGVSSSHQAWSGPGGCTHHSWSLRGRRWANLIPSELLYITVTVKRCHGLLLSQVGSEELQEQCDDSDHEQSQEAEWMVRTHDAHPQGQVCVCSWSISNSGPWCHGKTGHEHAEPSMWQCWFDFQVSIQQGCVCSRFSECAQDPDTKVLILTGADPYYCAGVDLSATIKPMHPKYVKSFSDDLYQLSVLSTSF